MPKFLVPRHNTPHRVAAIALYRALLSQAKNLPSTTQDQRNALQNIIRNRFKQSQHSHSYRRLKISFEAGYEAIDYLDAAVGGSEESKTYILDLLERSPAKAKEPKPRPLVVSKKRDPNFVLENNTNDEAKISLSDRPIPLEKLSGKRHVPVLFNANHIPVLRLKKPQPVSLSRYIRQRIDQRQEWHDRRSRLSEELYTATREDEWDDLVRGDESAFKDGLEPSWRDAIDDAAEDVHKNLDRESMKNRVMAEKMQAVVDREQALFDKEKRERREAKARDNLAKIKHE